MFAHCFNRAGCDEPASVEGEQAQNRRTTFDCCGWSDRSVRVNTGLRFGVFLIIVGLLLFAVVAGHIQAGYFWPVALIVFGVWMYVHKIICGVPMIVGGSLWLGKNLAWFPPDYFWPLFIMIIGIWIVAARLAARKA